jgi:type IV secretory pathway TrbD component
MKTPKESSGPEPRTIALLAGLAVGLGIIVHEFFFWVAVGIWAFAASEWVRQREREHPGHHRYLIHHRP